MLLFVLDSEKLKSGVTMPDAIMARYDIVLADLQRCQWMLSYPPNENMADIKMWPPYSSYNQ